MQPESRGGPNRNAAFAHFKHEDANGRSLAAAVKERSQQHKEMVASIRVRAECGKSSMQLKVLSL